MARQPAHPFHSGEILLEELLEPARISRAASRMPIWRSALRAEPRKISGPAPTYPEEARQEKVMGVVALDALVDARGRVQDVTVLKSPDNRLSEAAIAAVRDWIFELATKDGVPVAVRYQLTVKFALQ